MLKLRKRTFGEFNNNNNATSNDCLMPACPSPPHPPASALTTTPAHPFSPSAIPLMTSLMNGLSTAQQPELSATHDQAGGMLMFGSPNKRVKTNEIASQRGRLRESHFPPLDNPPQINLEELRTTGGNAKKVSTQQQQQPAQQSQGGGGRLYTEDEVREIVMRMVQVREQQLRREYDAILTTKLQEQFANFAQFNQDYISRQFKQSDFSYTS